MKKKWLSHYAVQVPHEIDPDKYVSVVELFTSSCKKHSERPAFISLGSAMTYGQLAEAARSFAAFLQNELKAKKGDRIALMLPNTLQYPVCMFGAFMAGLTVINVNPLYTARELVKQLMDCEAETIVVLTNFAGVLQHALPETKIRNVIVTEIGDLCGLLRGRLINYVTKKVKKKVPEWYIPYACPLRKILEKGRKLRLQKVRLTGDDMAVLQYTGGTTGTSKGAILTHRNLVANVEQTAAWMGSNLVDGEEEAITILPLYHVFALTVCCLTFLKIGVSNVLIADPRNYNDIAKTMTEHNISVFVGVNSLFNALLHTSAFRALNFESLKLTVGGGMAVQGSVAERWHEVTKCPLLEGYGLTEASPVVSMAPLTQQEFRSSIGLPLPSTDVSIRDEQGNEVPQGTEGELCVQGPQVMRGYLNQDEETKAVFWEDGWLRTGDIAVMDEKGFMYIVDRKKDIIVTSGYNVYPNEIEDVLVSHPAVIEVAVVGVAHSHAGEIVKAFIVRKDDSLTKEKVVAFCKDRLTSYKVPKRVEFRDELPKSNVGKILRRALREEG